jgi:hypothetical protein
MPACECRDRKLYGAILPNDLAVSSFARSRRSTRLLYCACVIDVTGDLSLYVLTAV